MKYRALLLASLLATTANATAGENTFNIYSKGDVRDRFIGNMKSSRTLNEMNRALKKQSPNLYAIDQNQSGKFGGWHAPLGGNSGYTPGRNAWGFSFSAPATGTNKSYAQQKR